MALHLVSNQLPLTVDIVIATKYTTNFKARPDTAGNIINYAGNGTKSLYLSVRASLQKLQTDYIDLVRYKSPHWAATTHIQQRN